MDKIIDLKELSEKREIAREHKVRKCKHGKFLIDIINREVTCQKCEKLVDPIEVLGIMADRMSDYYKEVEKLQHSHDMLQHWNPNRKIIKAISDFYNKKHNFPCCPICKEVFDLGELAKQQFWRQGEYYKKKLEKSEGK